MDVEARKARSRLEVGERIACRYVVEAHHRSHPLGDLYRCRDEAEGRVVVLQRLERAFAEAAVRDRLFETRGSAAMESPLIADLLDYGVDIDGRVFLVTAWTDDASLDAVERPLSFVEAVTIVERIATALAPLHELRMVHGGIEPASVLVDDERAPTGLLDFGLAPALAAGAERSRAQVLLASPAYAAPELGLGERVAPGVDVYALGIVLWELIFGAVPFRGPTLRVLDAHRTRALPELELPFDAPPSFEWVLRRMLAKSPADRFGDAAEVVGALRPFLAQTVRSRAIAGVLDVDVAPAQGLLDDDDDDDETVIFDRVNEDSVPPMLRSLADYDRPAAVQPARGSWIPGTVAVMVTVVILVVSLIVITGRGRAGEASGTAPELALGLDGSAVAAASPEPVELEREALVDPVELAAPDLAVSSAVALEEAEFLARKTALYRRVRAHCIDGKVRRTVKLAVRVEPSGDIRGARVTGSMGSTKLGRCVARQARHLQFPASDEGGRYVYTLRLKR